MDKTAKLGLLGAISSLVALPISAIAAQDEPAVAPAQTFSDLLQPIDNPVQKLKVSDAQALARSRGAELIQTRWRRHYRRHYYYGYSYPYYGYSYAVPYYYGGYYRHHHHHHHHHHHSHY